MVSTDSYTLFVAACPARAEQKVKLLLSAPERPDDRESRLDSVIG